MWYYCIWAVAQGKKMVCALIHPYSGQMTLILRPCWSPWGKIEAQPDDDKAALSCFRVEVLPSLVLLVSHIHILPCVRETGKILGSAEGRCDPHLLPLSTGG